MCKCETVLTLFAQFQCCDRRLLSAKLRSFRIHLLKQTKGAFLPLPCIQTHSEALASLFNLPFRNGGKVQCYDKSDARPPAWLDVSLGLERLSISRAHRLALVKRRSVILTNGVCNAWRRIALFCSQKFSDRKKDREKLSRFSSRARMEWFMTPATRCNFVSPLPLTRLRSVPD
jgi:hypothetical protein